MARKKNQIEEVAEVAESTIVPEIPEEKAGAGRVAIACCLAHGLKFSDVPCGNGTKTVVFPGINNNLRGATSGVLALPGNALCVYLDKADWEAIKRMHGNEQAFTGVDGAMPCIYELRGTFKEEVRDGVISEMKTGLEGADPTKMKVAEESKN